MNKQEALVGQLLQDKARVLQDKPISVPPHPPQILNGVASDYLRPPQPGKIYAVP